MIWSKENNQLIKNHFLNDLTNFIETLTTAQESINDRILLKSSDEIDLTQIQNTSDYVATAANNENLAIVEELMRTWIRQMEQVKRKKLKLIFILLIDLMRKGFSRKRTDSSRSG